METRLMLSVPPATTTSARPPRISSTAIAMVWRPEEQNLLMVAAGTVWGRPAFKVEILATFMPCSPSGMAHPMRTSSTSSGLSPRALFTASRMATAPRSSGRTVRKVPFLPFPIAVLTPLTITASLIYGHSLKE